jgi:hypothetical protein
MNCVQNRVNGLPHACFAAIGTLHTANQLQDEELKESGTTWFRRNILELTSQPARELIRGRSGERAQVDYDRLQAYRMFMGLNAEGGPGAS